jgi:hypothetical protein
MRKHRHLHRQKAPATSAAAGAQPPRGTDGPQLGPSLVKQSSDDVGAGTAVIALLNPDTLGHAGPLRSVAGVVQVVRDRSRPNAVTSIWLLVRAARSSVSETALWGTKEQ